MNDSVGQMAFEYMLTEKEFQDEIIPVIENRVTPKWLEKMYSEAGRDCSTLQDKFVMTLQNISVPMV